MKKILLTILTLFFALSVNAETIIIESNLNMENFWQKNGKNTEKVLYVARKLIHDNNLQRAPIIIDNNSKSINANANTYTKSICISSGLFPYIDNDDELV